MLRLAAVLLFAVSLAAVAGTAATSAAQAAKHHNAQLEQVQ